MKKTARNPLILLNIITALLIIIVSYYPSNILRILLGLPFVLFIPGYTLTAALYPARDSLDGIERLALSFGLSLVTVPIIGFILNYTPWGVALYPVFISVAILIAVTSIIAWYRKWRLDSTEKMPIE